MTFSESDAKSAVTLPGIAGAFKECLRPVFMPESYLPDLIHHASERTIRIQPRYSASFETSAERAKGREDLLLLFFSHRAPMGFLQDFFLELRSYSGDDDQMIRYKEALEILIGESDAYPGRIVGSDLALLNAVRAGRRDASLDQRGFDRESLTGDYFIGAALLWRLRRDRLLSDRDETLLRDLSLVASVDETRCDAITQVLRLQRVPWRESVETYDPERGESRQIRVLDSLIELFWGDLESIPESLIEFHRASDDSISLKARLRDLLREVSWADVSSNHILNPGFAYYPPKAMNLAFARSVGRDGANSLVFFAMRENRVVKRALVPTRIHPAVLDHRLKPFALDEGASRDAPRRDLEDARLHLFLDPEDDRYKILLTYLVAGGEPFLQLETVVLDVEKLLDHVDSHPHRIIANEDAANLDPERMRAEEDQLASAMIHAGYSRSVPPDSPARESSKPKYVISGPFHPFEIPENRKALLELGMPHHVFDDPDACVKDASRSRASLYFGDELRVVDIWEFRSKTGGGQFLDAPLYRGRFQNPEPSWIGRVALDPETSRILGIPVMHDGSRWRFKPYLISEDRFAWIGGSSQRELVDFDILNPVTGQAIRMAFGMNVIHTTNEVPVRDLPYCYQPTRIDPGVTLHKYELRVTFEPNPNDPFAEPMLYDGIAATPRWLEDWTGWVGRAKFNDNFIARPANASDGEIASGRVFEFLMAGGDHVIQRAACDLDALRPLSLAWSDDGEWIAPPLTPFVNPMTGTRYHSSVS